MAFTSHRPCSYSSSFVIFVLFFCFIIPCYAQIKGCPFDAIYNFGDGESAPPLRMLDHLAPAFHLPPPPSHYAKDGHFPFYHGTNFASRGSTIGRTPIFVEKHTQPQSQTHSLESQEYSFIKFLKSITPSPEQALEMLGRSLFIINEAGLNDYKNAFQHGKSVSEVYTYVPPVVAGIKVTLMGLIEDGATNILVPGSLPLGCLPGYTALFPSNDPTAYDAGKCEKELNSFAVLHNDHLQQALMVLREEFPHARIIYLDYYNAFMALLHNHAKSLVSDGFGLTEEALKSLVDTIISQKGFAYPEVEFPEVTHCVM
ncbi:hypothetical protein RJ639_005588 [Escallonia herrerae]|uniref:GDSL esterase/lipase n=1 Tax=Escallonia herrerae TaxID=1293975 RepID=A0AA88VW18_9ASTE|nr:hypothetical protein RJ639_005588 [Escallonia herrerae]